MSQTPSSETLKVARRAVAQIRSYGIDGPRPIEEIEALLDRDDEVDVALSVVVRDAGPDDLAAAVHLVSLMRRAGVLEAVREAAFERPSSLQVKREAVEALERCDADVDADTRSMLDAAAAIADAPDSASLVALLEWPPAWRSPTLDAWLAAAGAEQLSSVEIALGVEPDLDARLLDWVASLATVEAARVLQGFIAGDADKDRVKQAKKALHRLRSHGVEIAEASGGGFSMTIESDALQDARAYVTSVDGRGARLVWVLWRAASGGSRLLQAVVDDIRGVHEAEVVTVTRSGFRDYLAHTEANPSVILQQSTLEHAMQVLAGAAFITEDRGGDLPDDYVKFAEVAGISAAAAGRPRIYSQIGAADVRGDAALIEASMTLLREPHFQSWALEGPVIDEAAGEIQAAETSTLMISDEQRRERMQDAISQAVRTSFDEQTRAIYRRRLESMAGMLWQGGDEELARQALASAVGLTEIEDLFHGHAFARALAHRGVWLAYQDKQREATAEEQRSRIIQP